MLPPYGLFALHHRVLASRDEPMDDFLPNLGQAERKQKFLDWRNKLRGELSELVWPYLQRHGGSIAPTWRGLDSATALSIVGLELNLMIEKFQGEDSVLEQEAEVVDEPEFGSKHLQQFYVEDHPNQPAAINLRDYVSGLSEQQFLNTRGIVEQAYSSRKLPGLFWFKNSFMRTRPYQASLILGKEEFENYPALSARHSSFYSGHCLEGIIFCAAIEEYWRSLGSVYSSAQFDQLAQYAIDFGDRRVFAGVHYPSDNVGSWIMALRLARLAFDEPEKTFTFIRNAIVEKSLVFQLIEENFSDYEVLAPIRTFVRIELGLEAPMT